MIFPAIYLHLWLGFSMAMLVITRWYMMKMYNTYPPGLWCRPPELPGDPGAPLHRGHGRVYRVDGGKSGETHGKSWETHGKWWENSWKIMENRTWLANYHQVFWEMNEHDLLMILGKRELVCDYCSSSVLMSSMIILRSVEWFNPDQRRTCLFSEMLGTSRGKALYFRYKNHDFPVFLIKPLNCGWFFFSTTAGAHLDALLWCRVAGSLRWLGRLCLGGLR